MHSLTHNIGQYLSADGPLARGWPGYDERPEQLRLAQEIERGIECGVSMALEAPTGTGKTLSYLLPALLSRRRVILSVGNLTLQDHLWLGEYQKLRALLPDQRGLIVLKGCDNYFCHHRYNQAREGMLGVAAQTLLHEYWGGVISWLQQSRQGEIQSLPFSADQILLLKPSISLSADQCLGKRCSYFAECYFQKARQRASQAELLLINHTLLLSDQRLFEKGMGALLPGADAIVVDEAHQIPDLLMRRNTETMEEYFVLRWIRQVRRRLQGNEGLFPGLPPLLMALEKIWRNISQQIEAVQIQAQNAGKVVSKAVAVAPTSLRPLWELLQRLEPLLVALHTASVEVTRELEQLRQWSQLLQKAEAEQAILYCEVTQSGMTIIAARVQSPFVGVNAASAAWIFLSATLVVDDSFEFFTRSLSLSGLENHRHQLALDYEKRACCWVPQDLPLPTDEDFYAGWSECLLELCELIDGGILALFSSHSALQQVAAILNDKCGRPMVVYQPGCNRHGLLQSFRQQRNGLLLATGSFWEGIDIQGEALRCVAIDKLPFAAPDDILSLAWKFKAGQDGLQQFRDFMVPHAVTRLRQGVGRLLRRPDDAGLVVLGDQRILKKSYGGRFRAALSPMPLVQSRTEVNAFLQSMGIAINN